MTDRTLDEQAIGKFFPYRYRILSDEFAAFGIGAVGVGDEGAQVDLCAIDRRVRADGDLASSTEYG